ncbi:GNAT family N-acetyltransferase [Gymnodinialimonas sp. 2305UL16-5]|uniref:GNAT family N-acetyltransferase n=1 Tax=Gymnodinialimonas mytili TaxID=3126503 RepID=UPI0030B360E8
MIPTLHTERLTLRAPAPQDFEAIAEFRASDRASFVGGPATKSQSWTYLSALIGHWTMRGYGRWIVTETGGDNTAIGIVGPFYPLDWPEPEIAWTLFASGEGHGYAYEAAHAARGFAYDRLGWNTAASFVNPDNIRSVALAKRLGCSPEHAFDHEVFGKLHIWRHPSAGELAR